MSGPEMDVEPFTDAANRFEVTVDGHAYVLEEDDFRAFLASGLEAVGCDGTQAWRADE